MTDNEIYSVQLEELEILYQFFQKPIHCNVNNKADPEQVLEALFDELLNSRKKASKAIELAKSFQSCFEKSAQKVKILKRDKLAAIDRYERTLTQLETFEKTVFQSEKKIDYMTNEIYDLEATIRESNKEKEKIKKELSDFRKESKHKLIEKDDSEIKTLSFAKGEIEKKLSEAHIEVIKKCKTIEELSGIITGYENKILSDNAFKNGQASQINSLKNQIFEKSNKISDMKTIAHSLRAKIQSVEEELITEQDRNAALLNELAKVKEREKEREQDARAEADTRSKTEAEELIEDEDESEESSPSETLDENLLEMHSKRTHMQRSEILSDFFTEEDRIDTGDKENQHNGNLVYFIASPSFHFPRSTNMSISAGELISIFAKVKHAQSSVSFADRNRVQSQQIQRNTIDHYDNTLSCVDARKKHFIKVLYI